MGNFMSLGRSNNKLSMRRDEPMTPVKFQIPGHGDVEIDVPGETDDEVRAAAIEWLADDDWITISAKIDGSRKDITFRGAWVASFSLKSR